MTRILARVLLAVVAVLASVSMAAAGGGVFPYELGIRVKFGEELGSERVRERIEKEILERIEKKTCYRSVRRHDPEADPDPDLLLVVLIEEVLERVEHDRSLAGEIAAIREDPQAALRVSAIVEVTVFFDLVHAATGSTLRRTADRPQVHRRPQFLGEDYQQAARDLAIKHVSVEAQKFACKGSPKKLEKAIREAAPR